ncbi:hypothetical protein [Daejeonella sp.]|uniref:hypothetical protein n=1 Tax=Daejeonella sp. TaxID=2805397 RepID=UPI0030BC0515
MKTLKLISIVIILSLASCRSRELNFVKSKSSELGKEKISLNESHSEAINGVRVVDIRDSSRQLVGMRIYPLDTFSLSVDNGFRGRASVIEYWGVKESVTDGKDSSAVVVKKDYSIGYVGEREMRKNEVSKSREVWKISLRVMVLVVIMAVGMFGFWLWIRLIRPRECGEGGSNPH